MIASKWTVAVSAGSDTDFAIVADHRGTVSSAVIPDRKTLDIVRSGFSPDLPLRDIYWTQQSPTGFPHVHSGD